MTEEKVGTKILFCCVVDIGEEEVVPRGLKGPFPEFPKDDPIFQQTNETATPEQLALLKEYCKVGSESNGEQEMLFFDYWKIYVGKWGDAKFKEYALKQINEGICVAQIFPWKQGELNDETEDFLSIEKKE
jgi:hypothetical protein